jgi:hypothetical protein
MAIIGQGVQAGLGRIDYSPYLQGAAAGAQGIAQGIASFGQSVGSGIQNYLKKEEEKKREQEGIEFIKNQFPGIDDKAAKAGLNAAGGPAAFVKFQSEQNAMREAAAARNAAMEDQRKAAQVAAYLQQGGGNLPSPVNRGAFTAEQLGAGRLAYTQLAQAEANLGKTRAETTALGIPKAPARLTPTQQYIDSGLRAYRLKYGAEPSAEEEQKIVSEAMEKGRAQTTIKTGDEVLTRSVFDTLKGGYDTAVAAQRALPAYAEARKLLAEGNVITGAGAEPRLALAKGLALFGISSDNVSNTEVLRAQLAQPVFALVKQLGSGSGISNADLDFSKKAAGGEIALDSKTIARLVDIGERASKLSIESYRDRLNRTYPKGKEEFSTARAVLELPDVIQPMPF